MKRKRHLMAQLPAAVLYYGRGSSSLKRPNSPPLARPAWTSRPCVRPGAREAACGLWFAAAAVRGGQGSARLRGRDLGWKGGREHSHRLRRGSWRPRWCPSEACPTSWAATSAPGCPVRFSRARWLQRRAEGSESEAGSARTQQESSGSGE